MSLSGQRILVPESRELDLFCSMLERAGATVFRSPLVTILDLEDDGPALAWIRRLIAGGFDDLVLYTGEGVTRLGAVTERAGLAAEWRDALGRVRLIVRGPKPTRALRLLGLQPQLSAEVATTAGLLDLLRPLDLKGRRIGIQGYPEQPPDLAAHLADRGADVEVVVPYRYADDQADERVLAAIDRMAEGEIDIVAFTSTPQVRRLDEVARKRGVEARLRAGMARVRVAAVGPVTAEALARSGWSDVMQPAENFHLKPMIALMGRELADRD